MTSTSVPPSRPVAGFGHDDVAVGAGQHRQQRGRPEQRLGRAPAVARQPDLRRRRAARPRRRGRGTAGPGSTVPAAAAAQPASDQTSGTPISRKTTSADSGLPGSPRTGTPLALGEQRRLARLDRQAVAPDRRRARRPRRRSRPARRPRSRPRSRPGRRSRAPAGSAELQAPRSSGRCRRGPARRPRRRPGRPAPRRSRRGPGPGRSVAVSGGTTSSPVEKIATRGSGVHASRSVTPAAASSPSSAARSGRPAWTSAAPAATSSSARTSPAPGATGRVTSIVPGIVSAVYSTITTASAPGGSTAPVGMATQPPGRTATSGAAPIRTAPSRSR